MTEWFRIIVELESLYTQAQIGSAVGMSAVSINRYKQGTEPRHSVGVVLLDLHSKLPQRQPVR